MKETREETYKDVYKFSHRLDEIFEQGMPTKAQIIDAFNKFSGSKHIPTDEIVQKKIFALCSEMRHWDGKSSPKTTPELLNKFWQWMKEYASQSQSSVLPSEELYKKIYVKSKIDLPKTKGNYIVSLHPVARSGNESMTTYLFNPNNQNHFNSWLRDIDWYLQLVQKSQLKHGYPKEFVLNILSNINEGYYRPEHIDELYTLWIKEVKQ